MRWRNEMPFWDSTAMGFTHARTHTHAGGTSWARTCAHAAYFNCQQWLLLNVEVAKLSRQRQSGLSITMKFHFNAISTPILILLISKMKIIVLLFRLSVVWCENAFKQRKCVWGGLWPELHRRNSAMQIIIFLRRFHKWNARIDRIWIAPLMNTERPMGRHPKCAQHKSEFLTK